MTGPLHAQENEMHDNVHSYIQYCTFYWLISGIIKSLQGITEAGRPLKNINKTD